MKNSPTPSRRGASALIAALALTVGGLASLAGCAATGNATASSSTPVPTVTVTATAAPVATPPSPDDPVDALTAWHACAVLGLANYAADNPGSELRPYDPEHPPTKNADGTYQAYASFSFTEPVEGAASMVTICTIGGTMGQPTLVKWLLKDI